jgi:hypothetical protein
VRGETNFGISEHAPEVLMVIHTGYLEYCDYTVLYSHFVPVIIMPISLEYDISEQTLLLSKRTKTRKKEKKIKKKRKNKNSKKYEAKKTHSRFLCTLSGLNKYKYNSN